MMVEAEDEKSSAFSVSQEDIDSVLQRGSSFQNGKYRIYHQFQRYGDGYEKALFSDVERSDLSDVTAEQVVTKK